MLALVSMRLEKGYRSWKGDLSSDYTMLENCLERWVSFDKPAFVGRDALIAERDEGVSCRFACFTVGALDADAPPLATVWAGDKRIGLTLSAGFGHRTGHSIALCMVDAAYAVAGSKVEIEIYGDRRPAVAAESTSLYDPQSERPRC